MLAFIDETDYRSVSILGQYNTTVNKFLQLCMVELLPSFADFGHPNVSNLCEEKRQKWRKI